MSWDLSIRMWALPQAGMERAFGAQFLHVNADGALQCRNSNVEAEARTRESESIFMPNPVRHGSMTS